MSIVYPAQDILGARTNEAGVTYDPLDKTRIYAEELNALYARAVSGTASANPFSLAISGTEALSEDRDASLRGILGEGGVGGILLEGAGARLIYHAGKKAFRVGEVTGTAWDDANIGSGSIGLGIDVEALHDRAIVVGSGVDDANRLATTADDQFLLGFLSDVPTVRVMPAAGVGTVGLTGIGLGATLPTAVLDLGASSTARASIRLRPGDDPSAPNDGDIWINGADVKIRTSGSVKTLNTGPVLPAFGPAGDYLRSSGAAWTSSKLDMDDAALGKLAATRGGTGQAGGYAVGDLLYADTASTLAKRAVGATGDLLSVVGGLPAYVSQSSVGSGDTVLGSITADLTIATKQNVYTVPGGKRATITRVEVIAPNGTIGNTSALRGGWLAPATNVIASMTTKDIDASTQYGIGYPDNPASIGAAGQTFGVGFANANLGTATTVTVRVIGREFV